MRFCSLPVHATSSRKIDPIPAPKCALVKATASKEMITVIILKPLIQLYLKRRQTVVHANLE